MRPGLAGARAVLFVASLMILGGVLGCERGGDERDAVRDQVSPDTFGSPALLDSLAVQEGADAAAAPSSPTAAPSGEQRSERLDEPAPAATPDRPRDRSAPNRVDDALSDTYRLARVEGEPLPAVIGDGPDCVLQVVAGELVILGEGFVLQTRTQEVCAGRIENEETQRSSGSITVSGATIRFEGSVEGEFGFALGRLDGRSLVIFEIGAEADPQSVEWVFVR